MDTEQTNENVVTHKTFQFKLTKPVKVTCQTGKVLSNAVRKTN